MATAPAPVYPEKIDAAVPKIASSVAVAVISVMLTSQLRGGDLALPAIAAPRGAVAPATAEDPVPAVLH